MVRNRKESLEPPARLQEAGFVFRYPELEGALRHELWLERLQGTDH